MKFLCKALLELKNLKQISIRRLLIIVLVAFGSGQLSPDLITLLLSS